MSGARIVNVSTAQVSIGLINDVPTCEELMRRMEKEAEDVVNGLQRTIVKAKL